MGHPHFNYPYVARSATEFWRRWNMSLGSFFRDYVYIPLGGNRRMQVRNLFVVWFLTGLWHGASWNFVIWGLYFGSLIYLERILLLRVFQVLPKWMAHAYLTFAMLAGWVLFYFTDMSRAIDYLRVLFGLHGSPLSSVALGIHFRNNVLFLIVAVIGCTPWPKTAGQALLAFVNRITRKQDAHELVVSVANLIIMLIATALLVGSTYNPFLYFRF